MIEKVLTIELVELRRLLRERPSDTHADHDGRVTAQARKVVRAFDAEMLEPSRRIPKGYHLEKNVIQKKKPRRQ